MAPPTVVVPASVVPALVLVVINVVVVRVVGLLLLLLLLLLLFWPSFVHTRLGCLVRVIVTVGEAAFFGTVLAADAVRWRLAPTVAGYVLWRGFSSERPAAAFDQVYLWRRTDSAGASGCWLRTGMPRVRRRRLAGPHYRPSVQHWILP